MLLGCSAAVSPSFQFAAVMSMAYPYRIPITHNLFWQKHGFSLHLISISISSKSQPNRITSSPLRPLVTSFTPIKSNSVPLVTDTTSGNINTFTWDDVVRLSQPQPAPTHSSDLSPFFDKIQLCNRGSELQSDFLQFIIEDQLVGYLHHGFVDLLRRFSDVFIFPQSNSHGSRFRNYVTLHESLKTAEDRTRFVAEVIRCLGEEKVIPGIRNELYPVVSSFGSQVYFSLERAAAPYFGIKAYGVHMNGFVERDEEKFLWIGKRSALKPTYPGMLDHLAAGGLPYGISCGENIVKECEEEAGIPLSISQQAIPVGAVSYIDIEGFRYKRDVLFCYDLKLPDSFIPESRDGEVESFKLIPVKNVANVIRKTHFFKPNCSLVIIDFLFRHGYISPECLGYLDLLQRLKNGDCS
ncbi:nudix hydrolase 20, chloroplastic-like [Euphorbia lathyris]|uniref:nudix hydrolase 20, chloroplastic-like n=1 Tax=Euphorbia lathyris TaxID=212925 RepID=UPI0033139E61